MAGRFLGAFLANLLTFAEKWFGENVAELATIETIANFLRL